jgi:flagellar hook-associated protein 2
MSITPLRFTGISNFSNDFQAIVDRAVAIAALPIKQMQNQQSDLIIKKQSLSSLGTSLQSVGAAIRDLGQTASDRAITATSSNTTKVTVQMTGVAAATAYTITDIESVARQASESTLTGYADTDTTEVDADGILELVIGDETHEIDLTDYGNNLDGLKEAINDLGAGVRASIVNTGSETNPYYLSVTATSTGETTLQLRGAAGDELTNLVTAANQGANAKFKLNGLQIEKSDNAVTDVIEGLTFNILSTTEPDESVVLNLASNRGTLATKITAFVAAYNSAMAAANSHVGENAGLLSGDSIIGTVQRALRGVVNYRETSGGIKALTDLGIEIDKQGVMSFDTSKFYSLTNAKIDDAFTFFGSTSTGFGATYSQIDALSNPFSGSLQRQQSDYDRADSRLTRQIEIMAERVTQMQATLSARLQLADTLLAQLESQQKMLETNLKSIEMVTFGKQDK